jgi:hypothetical protein
LELEFQSLEPLTHQLLDSLPGSTRALFHSQLASFSLRSRSLQRSMGAECLREAPLMQLQCHSPLALIAQHSHSLERSMGAE